MAISSQWWECSLTAVGATYAKTYAKSVAENRFKSWVTCFTTGVLPADAAEDRIREHADSIVTAIIGSSDVLVVGEPIEPMEAEHFVPKSPMHTFAHKVFVAPEDEELPGGLIAFAASCGSGKTTTMNAILQEISHGARRKAVLLRANMDEHFKLPWLTFLKVHRLDQVEPVWRRVCSELGRKGYSLTLVMDQALDAQVELDTTMRGLLQNVAKYAKRSAQCVVLTCQTYEIAAEVARLNGSSTNVLAEQERLGASSVDMFDWPLEFASAHCASIFVQASGHQPTPEEEAMLKAQLAMEQGWLGWALGWQPVITPRELRAMATRVHKRSVREAVAAET